MKLFFAGAENRTHAQILLELKVPYLLMSYWNLRGKSDLLDYLVPFKRYGAEIMLDSGAHTLQKGGNKIDYEAFFREYITFLKKNKEFFTSFVELDIENQVGLKKVENWTERIMDATGLQPIVVWHKERGFDYWIDMCKKYDYVGFSGFVGGTGKGEVPDKYVPLFLSVAKKYNAKVHGFGYTKPTMVKRYHFYSIDSSSWLSGCRWGGLDVFDHNTKTLRMNSKESFFKKFNKYNDLNNLNVDYWNATQWQQYQTYLKKYWENVEMYKNGKQTNQD